MKSAHKVDSDYFNEDLIERVDFVDFPNWLVNKFFSDIVDVHNKIHMQRLQKPRHTRGLRYTDGTSAWQLVDEQYVVPKARTPFQ